MNNDESSTFPLAATVERNLNILAWCSVAVGTLGLGGGSYVLSMGISAITEAHKMSEQRAGDPCSALLGLIFQPLFATLGPILVGYGILFLINAGLMIAGGAGALKRRPWSRKVLIAAAILFLPVGGGLLGALYSVPVLMVLSRTHYRAAFAGKPPPSHPATASPWEE